MTKSECDIARHLKHFLAEYLTQVRGYSLHTVHSYRDALCSLLRHLQEKHGIVPNRVTVVDLSAENVLGFLNELQCSRQNSDATRNQRLTAIRAFAVYLQKKDPTLTSDLTGLLAIPSKRTTRQVLGFLTRDEMDAVLEAPDADTWSGKRDRALFAAMYNTGARVSEIVGMLVSDVTLTSGGMFQLRGKGRKERALPLWKRTVTTLRKWIAANHLQKEQPLFANARGQAMTRSGVEKRLREAVRKAGETCPSICAKRVSPHVTRKGSLHRHPRKSSPSAITSYRRSSATITSPAPGTTPGSSSARIRKSQTCAPMVKPDSSATSYSVRPNVACTCHTSGGRRYSTGLAQCAVRICSSHCAPWRSRLVPGAGIVY